MDPTPMPRVTRTERGVELYFPPLRAPAGALALGAFGLLCAAIPAVGGAALLAVVGSEASGLLAVALTAGFVVPFFAFGVVFVAAAAYQLANALIVRVEPAGIATARRAFGVTFGQRLLAAADVAAIEPQVPSRLQNPFGSETVYRLVAATREPRRTLVVAESLAGEESMERVRRLIEDSLGVTRKKEQ